MQTLRPERFKEKLCLAPIAADYRGRRGHPHPHWKAPKLAATTTEAADQRKAETADEKVPRKPKAQKLAETKDQRMTNSNGWKDDENNGLTRNGTETTNQTMMVGIAAEEIWNVKQTQR